MKPGEILNNQYRIIREIHKGGQATVYLAVHEKEDLSFSKEVAIKVYEKGKDKESLNLSEIKILCSLNHPNIAKIIDVGRHDDKVYIVLEKIDGINLKELQVKAKEKKIGIEAGVILLIAKQVAEALLYAHKSGKGFLHRDVTPSNIMIDKNGEVQLLDFGISGVDIKLLAGKPSYLPTRILTGEEIYSESTDFYSLAIILYELSTGTKIKNEEDVDIAKIENKEVRELISNLISQKVKTSNLADEIEQKRNSKVNLKALVNKATDPLYIADITLQGIQKTSIKSEKRKTKWVIAGFVVVLPLIAGFIMYQKNKSDLNITLEDVDSRQSVNVAAPLLQFLLPIDDPKNFSSQACNSYCLVMVSMFTVNHKTYFQTEILKRNQDQNLGIEFNEHLERFANIYQEIAQHFSDYGLPCTRKSNICKEVKNVFTYAGEKAPAVTTKKENFENLKNMLDGSDKRMNDFYKYFSKGKWDTFKMIGSFEFVVKNADEKNNFILYNGVLNREICRSIGDEAYLRELAIEKKKKTRLNGDVFDVLILTNLVNIEYRGIKDIIPYYWIGLFDQNDRSISACHYKRDPSGIKVLQNWEITDL